MVKNEPTDPQFTSFMLTQQVKPEYWQKPMPGMENGNAQQFMEYVGDMLNTGAQVTAAYNKQAIPEFIVEEIAAVVHDKDQLKNGALKERHVHIIVKMNGRKRLSSVAAWIGVEPQYIERQKGRNGWENMNAYLIHATDSTKHQYAPEEVASAGYDYQEYELAHREKWAKARATVTRKRVQHDIDWAMQEILNGRMDKNRMLLDNELAVLYMANKDKIQAAEDTFAEIQALKTVNMIKNGDIKMLSYYVYGKPGSGKSRYSDRLISNLQDMSLKATGRRWNVFEAGATNPMDGYAGQEIILLDDLRIAAMSASDWLKLLDPYRGATMSARYKNREKASRVIVITSFKDPLEFFYFAKGTGGQSEAIDQFLRRLQATIQVLWAGEDDAAWGNDVRIATNLVQKLEAPKTHKLRIEEQKSKDNPFGLADVREVETRYDFEPGAPMELEKSIDLVSKFTLARTLAPGEVIDGTVFGTDGDV
jgi:hypothetical protein